MAKIRINGTEIEFDMKSMQQLSDEELETVSGGFQPLKSLCFYSWLCKTCHAEGSTFLACDSAFKEEMKAHKAATGHGEFFGLVADHDGTGYGVKGLWTETM